MNSLEIVDFFESFAIELDFANKIIIGRRGVSFKQKACSELF